MIKELLQTLLKLQWKKKYEVVSDKYKRTEKPFKPNDIKNGKRKRIWMKVYYSINEEKKISKRIWEVLQGKMNDRNIFNERNILVMFILKDEDAKFLPIYNFARKIENEVEENICITLNETTEGEAAFEKREGKEKQK